VLSRPQGQGTPPHFSKEVAMAINVSTFSSNQSYRLTNAVLVYQDASRKPAFVSVHDVKTDGEDRPIIQAGVPASKSGLLALMRILDP
jgi:hypothetical protein